MAPTISNVLIGASTIYIGTAGAYAATQVGYTEDGVQLSYEPTVKFHIVHEETFPIGATLEAEMAKILFSMAESDIDMLEAAFAGASLAADTLTIGGGSIRKISVTLSGDAPGTGSKTREIVFPYAVASAAVGMAFKKDDKTLVPIELTAIKQTNTTLPVCELSDFTEEIIASNVMTIDAGDASYRVDGQGDAADQLDTISGGDNGDVIAIRISDADAAITIADNDAPSANEINLTGSGNFVMNNRLDRLVLTKGSGYWVETSRVTA